MRIKILLLNSFLLVVGLGSGNLWAQEPSAPPPQSSNPVSKPDVKKAVQPILDAIKQATDAVYWYSYICVTLFCLIISFWMFLGLAFDQVDNSAVVNMFPGWIFILASTPVAALFYIPFL